MSIITRNRILVVCISIITGISLLLILVNPLNVDGDITFFVDSTYNMLQGAKPFVDLTNFNLLTAHYLFVPPNVVASVTGIYAASAWVLMVWILLIISMLTCYYLMRIIISDKSSSLPLIVPLSLALVSWLVRFEIDFGQREHVFALFLVPWVLMRYCRYTSLLKHRKLYVFIGLLVGFIASVKPFYLLIIGLIELYFMFRYKKLRPLIYTEMVGFALMGVIYIGILILNPDIFEAMMNSVQLTFDVYLYGRGKPPNFFDSKILIPFLIGIISLILNIAEDDRRHHLLGLFALITLTGIAMPMLQNKDNPYLLAVLWTGSILCVSTFIVMKLPSDNDIPQPIRRDVPYFIFITSIVVILTIHNWDTFTTTKIKTPEGLNKILETYTDLGDNVLMMDAMAGNIFPWLHVSGRHQSLGESTSFMTDMLFKNRDSVETDPDLLRYADMIRRDILESPPLIIINSDYMDFVTTYGLDDLILSRYASADNVEDYLSYYYVGEAPEQDIEFLFENAFELNSWRILGHTDQTLQACNRLTIQTWWNINPDTDTDEYVIHIFLVNGDNIIDNGAILHSSRIYTDDTSYIDERGIDIPCDIIEGEYNLLIAVQSISNGDGLSVQSNSGADYGQYAYIGNYMIVSEAG